MLTTYSSFLILFLLFVCAIEFSELDHINLAEIGFMIYALGFTLEKVAAMQEHGIKGGRSCGMHDVAASNYTVGQYTSRELG